MEQLKGIISRTQPLIDSVSLTTQSATQLDAATGRQLLTMMAEAQAFKHNQTLPPGTPDVYLQAWEEIVLKFGLMTFRDGLWRALRSSQFFPDPLDIEERCMAIQKELNADRALAKIKAEERAFKESGEERTDVGALMREVMVRVGRKAIEKRELPEPKMETCPHCSGLCPVAANMRFMSSEEIFELGKIKQEHERIAAANREANKAVNA